MDRLEHFNLVFDIGRTMLESGAELKRVEYTVQQVAKSLKIKDFNSYITITSIFMSATIEDNNTKFQVEDISISPIQLGKIDAINTMSRRLASGDISDVEVGRKLKDLKDKEFVSKEFKIFAYAFGSGSFGYIAGGSLQDSIGALFIGFVIALYITFVLPKLKMSRIFIDISTSMIATIVACVLFMLIPGFKLVSLIVGAIISLVPGVAIVNGIRYLFDEDYNAGWAQMVSAIVTASCISVGVGVTLKFFNLFI